jgi:hypothetical protein
MRAMRTPHRLALLALAVLTATATSACSQGCSTPEEAAPRIPASSDPAGKDLVEGAVVAAREEQGGIRLYKVTHVEEMPEPLGHEYHMIAYDPKTETFEQAAKTWQKRETKVVFEHLVVRDIHFLPREHRVVFVEPLTEAERATYTQSRDSRGASSPPPPAAPQR